VFCCNPIGPLLPQALTRSRHPPGTAASEIVYSRDGGTVPERIKRHVGGFIGSIAITFPGSPRVLSVTSSKASVRYQDIQRNIQKIPRNAIGRLAQLGERIARP
jgi:hypothetical protein